MKLCKYCKTEQPEENFGVASTINGLTYRRQKCRDAWLTEYKKNLFCVRCGFAAYRALDFHHLDPKEKDVALQILSLEVHL